ncbi:MAG: hypothetical protein AAF708_17545 [Deinococcota bacterium]
MGSSAVPMTEFVPLGYMAKKIADAPEELRQHGVYDIYSLSPCMSDDFTDYVRFWKHNGYWLFNSPADITGVAQLADVSLEPTTLFYYEAYPQEYADGIWRAFYPEPSLTTTIVPISTRTHVGYDIVSFYAEAIPECSPLSCNLMATEIPVNQHCLLDDLDDALAYINSGTFDTCEPGPLRIIAVYLSGLSSGRGKRNALNA